MARQLRLRAGMPRKTRNARTKPPPAPSQPLLPGLVSGVVWSMAVVAVVEMVAVPLPVGVPDA